MWSRGLRFGGVHPANWFTLMLVAFLWGAGSCSSGRAEQVFPEPGFVETQDPLANPNAPVGGQIVIWGGQSPKSLNYYLDQNSFTAQVFSLQFESLLNGNPLAVGEYMPGLARKWSISDDKRTFTFWMNPKAKWSDGKPVTAEDVKWTFDAVMDPKNITGAYKVYLGRLASPKVIAPDQVQFTANEVHWSNLDTLAGFQILPKHAYGGEDFNLVNFSFPVISGPYRIKALKEGMYLDMDRRADYWNRNSPAMRGIGNFQVIRYKFFTDREIAFQAFLKGDLDLYPVYTAKVWANDTQGEKFSKNWIVRQEVANHNPTGFQGFAMNMRRAPFDDGRVRKALAMLVDRNKMNSTIMYNQYFLQKSYFGNAYDAEHPCPNPVVAFDKDAARQLLMEAGWKANPGTGILEKNGKKFSFKFLDREASTQKFLAIYSEDLKDVGIELVPDSKDWAAWMKDMDSFNYDMTWAAWGGGTRHDPEPMWHSAEAERKSGNNLTGYKNPKVDQLIEKQRAIFDVKQQEEVVRQIDQVIFNEHPYVLLWNKNGTWLLYWNKFGTPPTVLSKYGDESAAVAYWWFDEDSAADLEDAMETGAALPKKASKVEFDRVFKGGGTNGVPSAVTPAAATPAVTTGTKPAEKGK